MNREIKFRAWDDLNKKWLLGYEYPILGGFSMKGEIMAFGEYSKMLGDFKLEEWDKIILMQYTGLKDKNGKEIYEEDLLRDKEGRVFVIKWLDSGLQFRLCATELRKGDWLRTYDLSSFGRLKHLEIISNIHENPELLTP